MQHADDSTLYQSLKLNEKMSYIKEQLTLYSQIYQLSCKIVNGNLYGVSYR